MNMMKNIIAVDNAIDISDNKTPATFGITSRRRKWNTFLFSIVMWTVYQLNAILGILTIILLGTSVGYESLGPLFIYYFVLCAVTAMFSALHTSTDIPEKSVLSFFRFKDQERCRNAFDLWELIQQKSKSNKRKDWKHWTLISFSGLFSIFPAILPALLRLIQSEPYFLPNNITEASQTVAAGVLLSEISIALSTAIMFFIMFIQILQALDFMLSGQGLFTSVMDVKSAFSTGLPYIDLRDIMNLQSWFYLRIFLLKERKKLLNSMEAGISFLITGIGIFFLVFVENKYGPFKIITSVTTIIFFYVFLLLCIFLLIVFFTGNRICSAQSSHIGKLRNMRLEIVITNTKGQENFVSGVDEVIKHLLISDSIPTVLSVPMNTSFLKTSFGIIVAAITFIFTTTAAGVSLTTVYLRVNRGNLTGKITKIS